MSINPVSSQAAMATMPKNPSVEAGEAVRAGKDVRPDGDADDQSVGTQPAAARQPTTNAMGELIGQHVNLKA